MLGKLPLAGVAALVAAVGAAVDTSADEWPLWPLTAFDFADPRVVTVGGRHFVTSTDWTHMLSFDRDWTNASRRDTPLYNTSLFWNGTYWGSPAWAFTPYQAPDKTWHAYVTGNEAAIMHCSPRNKTQVWSADAPITAWTMDDMLFHGGSYDSEVHVDEATGDMWLITNIGNSKGDVVIVAVPMANATTLRGGPLWNRTVPRAEWATLLTPDYPKKRSELRDPPPYCMSITESVHIKKVGGLYVLLYSVGDYALANYKVGVAYADALLGPYKKVYMADPDNVWGNGNTSASCSAGPKCEVRYLLQSWKVDWPGYVGRWMAAPGIASLTDTSEGPALVLHGRPATMKGPRQLWLVPHVTYVAAAGANAAAAAAGPFITLGGVSAPAFTGSLGAPLGPEFVSEPVPGPNASAPPVVVAAGGGALAFVSGASGLGETGLYAASGAAFAHMPLAADVYIEATFRFPTAAGGSSGVAAWWAADAFFGFALNGGGRVLGLQRNATTGAGDAAAFTSYARFANRTVGAAVTPFGAPPVAPLTLRLAKEGLTLSLFQVSKGEAGAADVAHLLLREKWAMPTDAHGGIVRSLTVVGAVGAPKAGWSVAGLQVRGLEVKPFSK